MNDDRGFEILQVAYLGIRARDLDAWYSFANDYLGMHVDKIGDTRLRLRMDERPQRLLIEASDREGLNYIGLEVQNETALSNATAWLEAEGYRLNSATAAECELRGISDMRWFTDADKNRIELFFGPTPASRALTPARPSGGFRTGALGFGHVVLTTPNHSVLKRLFQDLLGFRLSDFIDTPFEASFMHVNGRHHSLAIIAAPEPGLHHFMIEYNALDDVGRLYDRALEIPDRIAVTLGRHSNDHMLSFYSKTPGGFMIETGWAGRLIDDANWVPEKLTAPSLWGHERNWLSPEGRLVARRQREELGRQGVRAPIEVIDSAGFNLAHVRAR